MRYHDASSLAHSPHIGQRYLVRSLGSRDRDQARLTAAHYALVIGELFRQLRKELSVAEPKVEDIIRTIQSGGTRDLVRVAKISFPSGMILEGVETETQEEFDGVVERAAKASASGSTSIAL